MEPIIRFENVHFTYPEGEREILCGIDLEIDEGSFVAVLGHNGSGKSTLAKHMNAILLPTEGRVLVAGLDTADEDKLLELRRMQKRFDAIFDMRFGGSALTTDAREFDARIIAELAALVDGIVETALEHREDFEVLRLLPEHRRFDFELAEKALDGARRIEHAADVHEFIKREARAELRFFEVGTQVADASERRRGKARDTHSLSCLVEA